jgi:branched-chain amino acid transport system permease protein
LPALVGIGFGLPTPAHQKASTSAVATLAAQFFIPWLLVKVPWFSNYSASGRHHDAADRTSSATCFDTPVRRYPSWC